MDYFSIGLDCFCLAAQSILHFIFICRFSGQKLRPGAAAIFLLLVCALDGLARLADLDWLWVVGLYLLFLYAFSRLVLHNQPWLSGAAALLTLAVFQQAFGLINSLEAVLLPNSVGSGLLYVLVILFTLAALGICALCYAAVLKMLSPTELAQMPAFLLLLLPELFFLVAELYIVQTEYSYLPVSLSVGRHLALLVLQALGLIALFCTLYACQRICRGLQAQAELNSLRQAAQAQKTYIAEAQLRYTQTQSFRHDIKNHLAVLSGLLAGGRLAEGQAYLQKLHTASEALAFPYQTGSPTLDVLLTEKLGLAQAAGIKTEVSLLWPQSCAVDDFDLCVIFANALDNAYQACQQLADGRFMRIAGRRQGDFYCLEFTNSCAAAKTEVVPGIGLGNIRMAAEKYHGAVQINKEGTLFSLSVLLDIAA